VSRAAALLLLVAGCGDEGRASADLGVADLAMPVDLTMGACMPSPVPGFTASWQPPAPAHSGRCAPNQLTMGVYAIIHGGYANFIAMYPDCAACLLTASDDAVLGPMVSFAQYGVVDGNSAGCVAILTGDTSAASCAAESQAQYRCTLASCAPGCPVTNADELVAFDACVGDARESTGPCASFATDCTTTATVVVDGGDSIDSCFLREQGVTAWFTYLANLFCG
jgi:hypothetical protein